MNMKFFKDEIDRAIRVLGLDIGQCQNEIDIGGWLQDGYINEVEALELRRYNRKHK